MSTLGLASNSEYGLARIATSAEVQAGTTTSSTGPAFVTAETLGKSSLANTSLSNLNSTGSAVLSAKANTSLSNLDSAGSAVLDAKANTNLSNISTTGTTKIAHSVMPSNTRSVTLPVPGKGSMSTSYTAPADGWINWGCESSTLQSGSLRFLAVVYKGTSSTEAYRQDITPTLLVGCLLVPVAKGNKVFYYWDSPDAVTPSNTTFISKFIYADGSYA